MLPFQKFNKIPRLSRDIVITEKIDGTNAQVFIIKAEDYYSETSNCVDMEFINKHNLIQNEEYLIFAGSRNKWLDISSDGDNFGFAKWVQANAEELLKLGEGRHYGEYYGKGIQRNYGLDEKRFALFNVRKWADNNKYDCMTEDCKTVFAPKCCRVVPILYQGEFTTGNIDCVLEDLIIDGSRAVPGYDEPEGICIWHSASGSLFKKTIENDEKPKSC